MFSERQEQIIKAAIELIAENGIQQLTIKNLSKKIGLAEGALYRHFDSKVDILLGILTMFKANRTSTLEKIKSSEKSDALTKLESLFQQRFAQFTANPSITAVIFSEEIFQNDKRLSERVYSIMLESQAVIKEVIEDGQQANQLRVDISAKQLSLLITGALRLIVTQWRLSGFSFDLQNEGGKLWESIKQIVTK
ncbi:MAG: TetR/AcrR family transcriptional regulator [Calditrichaeota bacterium]|nr:MAG: TetR/AcrR family transcriptional regulator [Calditrichota bacterium]MBL1205223.1 TetR/AcrR family transcriptional regulator [Calditrichota bacterium]NOG45052.1 TetR/AcrR family transcriptional regulator [Calditrichota bacterium]